MTDGSGLSIMPQTYQNQFAALPERELSWGQLYDFIRIHNHRSFLKLRNTDGSLFLAEEKKELKSKLPMFAPNVVFDGKGTKGENIKHLSGSMFVDIDHLSFDADELANAKECLIAIPYVSAVWISPSGSGLHIIANVNLNHLTIETFAESWLYVMQKLKEESGIGGKWDEVVHNPERRVYISQDSKLMAKEVLEELSIPKGVRVPKRVFNNPTNGTPKTYANSKDFDRLHSSIMTPPTDFVLRLSAENMNPEGSQILRGGDFQSEVGLWYEDGFIVPDLAWNRLEKIKEGRRNSDLAKYITKWLWLNQPYVKDESVWKFSQILHSRVEQSGEYKTPYPIYNQIHYFLRNFDPNKTNPNSMKRQNAFFLRKSDLTKEDKSFIVRLKKGMVWDATTKELAIESILNMLDRLHTTIDMYPSKAKITIHTLHRLAEDVQAHLGGKDLSKRKLYEFCNGSEVIKRKFYEINLNRPFTEEAAMKWEVYEEILREQPERPISDIIKENDAQTKSRQTFYNLKAKAEGLIKGSPESLN